MRVQTLEPVRGRRSRDERAQVRAPAALRLNPDVLGVAAPPIPEARRWAERYGGRLGPAIDLTQAVPGYPPHPQLVARLAAAAGDRETYAYGNITGDLALREAYAAELSGLYGGAVAPEMVAITTGANMASYAVTALLARAGESVMLPVPWYFNHRMNAGLLGVDAVPLPCRADCGFIPDPDEAAALMDERVRAVFLVSPNNPTGAIYPPETLRRFSDLCRDRGIALVLDETYRDFLPGGTDRPHDLAESGWPEHLIQLYSFSKSYCVPGFRAGAVVAAPEVVAELAKLLDCLQICAPRIGQAGLAWAIDALAGWRAENRAVMNRRSDAARAAFARLGDWRLDSQGAYFAYLRHPFPGRSSWEVAEALAVERGVVTLPGEAFGPGQERHLRLAFANVEAERVAEVAERLRDFRMS
ncbi:MAG: aminotransferase [Methylobacteriaceae bacterium]|nr:aminotransferase [Methylobacteriaceae bacterium]